jgi:hypothetical protein
VTILGKPFDEPSSVHLGNMTSIAFPNARGCGTHPGRSPNHRFYVIQCGVMLVGGYSGDGEKERESYGTV